MLEVLNYLKTYGQRLDTEIAGDTGISIEEVRASITQLAEKGELSTCSVTRFKKGEEFKAILCRISGYVPPRSAGRTPGRFRAA